MGLALVYSALHACLVVFVQKSDFHSINVLCALIDVTKCTMSSPGSLLLFCTAQQQDTFSAYDQSYTFVQHDVHIARWS